MRRALPLVLLALLACSKKSPEPAPAPSASAAPGLSPQAIASAMPAPPAADDLAWTVPARWKTVPNPNAMRKATYQVPRAAGDTEDAECTVSIAMGSAEANVKRWAGQFGGAPSKTETREVKGLHVVVTEIAGTYSGGGMMGAPSDPKPKWMLLGAIVGTKEHEYFFKLTGPEATVSAARAELDALVASLSPKS